MALYMYMISVDQWEDSVFTPLFHEKKYTSEEFKDICNGIKNEIDNELDELTFQEEFIKIAIKEYGFKKLNVLEFNISNMTIELYK